MNNPGRHSQILGRCLSESFHDCNIVLELGGMIGDQIGCINARVRVYIEIYRKYIERRRESVRENVLPICYDMRKIRDLFVAESVDGILMVDALEHVTKEEGLQLLKDCETVARKEIVLWVPEGKDPQEHYDPLNLGGEKYQRHRATWTHQELETLGYDVAVWKDYHKPAPHKGRLWTINAMYCNKILGEHKRENG